MSYRLIPFGKCKQHWWSDYRNIGVSYSKEFRHLIIAIGGITINRSRDDNGLYSDTYNDVLSDLEYWVLYIESKYNYVRWHYSPNQIRAKLAVENL